jgi:hypothetical protein
MSYNVLQMFCTYFAILSEELLSSPTCSMTSSLDEDLSFHDEEDVLWTGEAALEAPTFLQLKRFEIVSLSLSEIQEMLLSVLLSHFETFIKKVSLKLVSQTKRNSVYPPPKVRNSYPTRPVGCPVCFHT